MEKLKIKYFARDEEKRIIFFLSESNSSEQPELIALKHTGIPDDTKMWECVGGRFAATSQNIQRTLNELKIKQSLVIVALVACDFPDCTLIIADDNGVVSVMFENEPPRDYKLKTK